MCGVSLEGKVVEVESGTAEVKVGGIENVGGVEEEDTVNEREVGVDGIEEGVKGGLDDRTDEKDVGGIESEG